MGPSASRLPASHTTSSAWATASAEPAVRSAVLSRPSPSRPASARPSAAAEQFAEADRDHQAGQDHDRADRRIDARQRILEVGRARIASAPPRIAPIRPKTWGIAPERQPRITPATMRHRVMRVERVHRPIVAQAARACVGAGAADWTSVDGSNLASAHGAYAAVGHAPQGTTSVPATIPHQSGAHPMTRPTGHPAIRPFRLTQSAVEAHRAHLPTPFLGCPVCAGAPRPAASTSAGCPRAASDPPLAGDGR